MRHPHEITSISGMLILMISAAVDPANRPHAVDAATSEQYLPRWFAGAYSARNTAAPEYSPAALKPWMLRSASSSKGDAIPKVSKDGRQPMRNAAPVMQRMETDRDHFLPFLSPMEPQNAAPSGRKTNERAKIAKAIRVESTDDSGKKT